MDRTSSRGLLLTEDLPEVFYGQKTLQRPSIVRNFRQDFYGQKTFHMSFIVSRPFKGLVQTEDIKKTFHGSPIDRRYSRGLLWIEDSPELYY